MISSKKYVDEKLREYHLVANKGLGQNFLVEEKIAQEIVSAANLNEESLVLEIGPGLGALSEIILQKCKKLIAFEIDQNMVNILNDTFKDEKKLTIYGQDFLSVDLKDLFTKLDLNLYHDVVVISNLPYYITSKILNRLIIEQYPIDHMVVMMQKEVGQKLLNPKKKEYNFLSVLLDYQYEVSIVKYVGKNAYLPRPNIDSIVLKIQKVEPRFKNVTFDDLIIVANLLFAQRRKTIYNNLKEAVIDKEKLEQDLKDIGLSCLTRVEELSILKIIEIVKIYKNNH